MATLGRGGRVTAGEVDEEIERLRRSWSAEIPQITPSPRPGKS